MSIYNHGSRNYDGGNALDALIRRTWQLWDAPNTSLRVLEQLDRLEDEIAARCHDVPAPTKQPSLTVVAHQIVWLDEAEFYRVHGDAYLISDDHYQGNEVLDWARDRHDRDAIKLASEASRAVLHEHICHVTGVPPAILHVGGGVATLDDGRQILEARLPPWADPLGRRWDHHDIAREIEASTYADFRRWLARFAEGAILGWEGSMKDCVMHRYYRQKTGVRWDCLRIDLDTTTVESKYTYATVTAHLPEFAAFISHSTTAGAGSDSPASGTPITAGWLRGQLPADWPDPQPL